MRLTPLPNLIYTRETNTVRATTGTQIKRFENTARAAAQSPAQYEPLGADFEVAVRAANMRAQFGTEGQAQAIIQGRDGAYYATPLVDARGRALTFDGVSTTPHPTDRRNARTIVERVVHTDWVLRFDPNVKAVVGGRSWANFTDNRVEFGLELIQSATADAAA